LLLGLLGGYLFLMANKPSYLAEAQVVIENLSTPFDKSNSVTEVSTAGPVDERTVQSQITALKSTDLGARVVDQLSLEKSPNYNAQLRQHGTVGGILVALGFKDDPMLFTPKELATKTLMSSVTVYPIPDSNAIGIKSSSGDGKLAADTANALAETFVRSTHEIGSTSVDRAREWLSKQIEDLRGKVAVSDAAVEKYRSESGLLKGTTATLGTQQISDLNAQITVADTAASEAFARAAEIKNMLATRGTVDASSDVLSSALVQNLREQQVSAQRKISELSAVYLPSHPKMIAARQELNAVNVQVRAEALKIVDSLNGQAKIAQARANAIRANLEKMKGSEADSNVSEIKLKALQREADANRLLLETMLGRYADASARQDSSLQPGYARIIQKAFAPPTPYFPKTGPILLLSTLAGLALGLGFAFVAEVMSAGVGNSSRPAERQRHHAINEDEAKQVAIPDFNFAAQAPPPPPANIFAPSNETAASVMSVMPAALTASAAYAMIEDLRDGKAPKLVTAAQRVAATLVGLNKSQGHASFTIASVGSNGPNAALATIATGRALSAQGHKTIVIDVSPANTGFTKMLGLESGAGLVELVSGATDFTKVVARDPSSSLHVIRYGDGAGGDSSAVIANRIDAILKALRSIYGFVLLHAGEANASTVSIVNASDVAVLLATQARLKDASESARAIESNGKTKTLLLKLDYQNQGPQSQAQAG
jgi:polysaccharide biosynthesis transport protein